MSHVYKTVTDNDMTLTLDRHMTFAGLQSDSGSEIGVEWPEWSMCMICVTEYKKI